MYIPSSNFQEPQQVEIICTMTGEAYVHLENDDPRLADPNISRGGIETLPTRFHQHPIVTNQGNNQFHISFLPNTP